MAARYEEGCYEKYIFTYVLVHEGLSTDDVGVAKGTVFQEIRPWARFKTGDFIQEKSGGYRRMTHTTAWSRVQCASTIPSNKGKLWLLRTAGRIGETRLLQRRRLIIEP